MEFRESKINIEGSLHDSKTGVWNGMRTGRIIGPIFFMDTINSEMYVEQSWELTVTQLVKIFPAFCGTQRFITVFTKSPLLVSILNQMHPVHVFPPYFPKIHSNIILPYMSLSSRWSLPFCFI